MEGTWLTTSAFFMSEEASGWSCPDLRPSAAAWLLLQCESLKREPGTAQLTFSNLQWGTTISLEASQCRSHWQAKKESSGTVCQVPPEHTAVHLLQ